MSCEENTERSAWINTKKVIGVFPLRPYIAYSIITIKYLDFGDVMKTEATEEFGSKLAILDLNSMYKYYNTRFLTPMYKKRADLEGIDKVLVPFLRKLASVVGLDWKVHGSKRKGLYGVLIPLRLYEQMMRYIITSENEYPMPVTDIMFMEDIKYNEDWKD